MEKLLILVSGGRSSAMMARHIQTHEKYDKYEKLFVFCNTGMERPETIQFLKDMVYYWDLPLNLIEGVYSKSYRVGVKSKIVDFETLNMTAEPMSGAIVQMNKVKWAGVPNEGVPYCSEYTKTRPSHDFARKIFGSTKYIKALGYRKEDIPKRITYAELKAEPKKIAPLLTDFNTAISQRELNIFFDNEPFKLSIHSELGNCELCWKKSDRNLIKAIQHGTRFIGWHKKKELEFGDMFFRGKKSIEHFVKLAESGKQLDMFSNAGDSCICNF